MDLLKDSQFRRHNVKPTGLSLQKANGGYLYVLVAIDIFSRYVWCVPVRNKTGDDIVNKGRENLNVENGSKQMENSF